VDPLVIATVVGPIAGAAGSIALDRGVRTITEAGDLLGHVSTHRVPNTHHGAPDIIVNTHSIWVANTGQTTAHNVRLTHTRLDQINVQVYPAVPHEHQEIKGGGIAIVFPVVPGKSQLQLQYVGIGVTTSDIMVGVYSDEGAAKVINVVPMKAQTKFVRNFTGALTVIGGAALDYVVLRLSVVLLGWITAQHFF
jgi:hypothetical protein